MANGTSTDDKTDRIAKHLLIDDQGTVVDEPEQATGIRYIHISGGQTVDYFPKTDQARLMFALFGAKTRATNEASRVRQQDKTASGDDQVTAIREMFDYVDGGKWVDRTRVAGPRYDHDILTDAAVQVMVDSGVIPMEQMDAAKAKIRAKLLSDDSGAVQKQLLDTEGVPETYRKLAGKTRQAASSLAGLLS